jgi:hypothetical protein
MTVSEDFTSLTGRSRGELLAHIYRMLGSADEAEDLVRRRTCGRGGRLTGSRALVGADLAVPDRHQRA